MTPFVESDIKTLDEEGTYVIPLRRCPSGISTILLIFGVGWWDWEVKSTDQTENVSRNPTLSLKLPAMRMKISGLVSVIPKRLVTLGKVWISFGVGFAVCGFREYRDGVGWRSVRRRSPFDRV